MRRKKKMEKRYISEASPYCLISFHMCIFYPYLNGFFFLFSLCSSLSLIWRRHWVWNESFRNQEQSVIKYHTLYIHIKGRISPLKKMSEREREWVRERVSKWEDENIKNTHIWHPQEENITPWKKTKKKMLRRRNKRSEAYRNVKRFKTLLFFSTTSMRQEWEWEKKEKCFKEAAEKMINDMLI
jgi:hypothetical protein